jgi:hypothetical protein
VPPVRFRVSHEFDLQAVATLRGHLFVEYQVNGTADEELTWTSHGRRHAERPGPNIDYADPSGVSHSGQTRQWTETDRCGFLWAQFSGCARGQCCEHQQGKQSETDRTHATSVAHQSAEVMTGESRPPLMQPAQQVPACRLIVLQARATPQKYHAAGRTRGRCASLIMPIAASIAITKFALRPRAQRCRRSYVGCQTLTLQDMLGSDMTIRVISPEEAQRERQELIAWLGAALDGESGAELYGLLVYVRRLIEDRQPSTTASS